MSTGSFDFLCPNFHCQEQFCRDFFMADNGFMAEAENSAAKAAQDVTGETAHFSHGFAKPKQKAEVKKTAKKNQQNKRSRQTPEEKKAEIALIRKVWNEKTKWQALQQIYKADKEKNSRWMRNVLPVVFTTSWTRKTTGKVRKRCTNSL